MRENEFEKQVQQKMGDLDLSPSDAVWTAVERRIRKEKKRRFIFWWPLFFLLRGGGIAAGIIWTNKKEKNKKNLRRIHQFNHSARFKNEKLRAEKQPRVSICLCNYCLSHHTRPKASFGPLPKPGSAAIAWMASC